MSSEIYTESIRRKLMAEIRNPGQVESLIIKNEAYIRHAYFTDRKADVIARDILLNRKSNRYEAKIM
jgi:hypothetical protein